MNPTNLPGSPSDLPWPTGDHRERLPSDAAPLPAGDPAAPAAAGPLSQAVQGTDDGIDRLALGAATAVQQLRQGLAAAEEALAAKRDGVVRTPRAWSAAVRTKVRRHPLAAVAAALALGTVLGRVGRAGR